MFYIFWAVTAIFAVSAGIWAGQLIDRRDELQIKDGDNDNQ